jgi:hypothetical protein
MVYYRARRISVPFDDNNIRDSLLNALRNLLGETRGAGGATLGPRRRRRRGRRASVPLAVPPQPAVGVPASWSPSHGVAPYHPPWPDMVGSSSWVPVVLAAMPPAARTSSPSTPPPRAAPAASTPPAIGSATAAVTLLVNGTAAAATPSPSTPQPFATIAARRAAPPLRLFSRDAGEILDPALAAPPPPPPSTPPAVNIANAAGSPTLRRTWVSVPHGLSARAQASPRANGRARPLENGYASPGMNGGGGASSSEGRVPPST